MVEADSPVACIRCARAAFGVSNAFGQAVRDAPEDVRDRMVSPDLIIGDAKACSFPFQVFPNEPKTSSCHDLRSGKIDVAEVLVLAAALDIPPVLLLFPQVSTDGGAVILPNFTTKEDEAARWMSGQVSFPRKYDLGSVRLEGQPTPPNEGVNLIAAMSLLEHAIETRISLVDYWHKVKDDAREAEIAQRMMEKNDEQIEAARRQVRDAREALWGFHDNYDAPDSESDD